MVIMKNTQTNIDLKRIAATLKYGKFDGTDRKIYIVIYVCLILIIVGTIVGTVFLIKNAVDSQENGNSIIGYAGGGVVVITLIGFFAYLVMRNEKARKEIYLWLDDAVELKAYSKKTGEYQPKAFSGYVYKIKIEFKYNGKRYSYFSRNRNDGYSDYWLYFLDQQVDILYSPKYEEVMILRPKDTPWNLI